MSYGYHEVANCNKVKDTTTYFVGSLDFGVSRQYILEST